MTDWQKKTDRGEYDRGEENAIRIHKGRDEQPVRARNTTASNARKGRRREREHIFKPRENAAGFTPFPSSKLSLHGSNGVEAGMVIERERNTERGGVYTVKMATATVLAEAAITKK